MGGRHQLRQRARHHQTSFLGAAILSGVTRTHFVPLFCFVMLAAIQSAMSAACSSITAQARLSSRATAFSRPLSQSDLRRSAASSTTSRRLLSVSPSCNQDDKRLRPGRDNEEQKKKPNAEMGGLYSSLSKVHSCGLSPFLDFPLLLSSFLAAFASRGASLSRWRALTNRWRVNIDRELRSSRIVSPQLLRRTASHGRRTSSTTRARPRYLTTPSRSGSNQPRCAHRPACSLFPCIQSVTARVCRCCAGYCFIQAATPRLTSCMRWSSQVVMGPHGIISSFPLLLMILYAAAGHERAVSDRSNRPAA